MDSSVYETERVYIKGCRVDKTRKQKIGRVMTKQKNTNRKMRPSYQDLHCLQNFFLVYGVEIVKTFRSTSMLFPVSLAKEARLFCTNRFSNDRDKQ